MISTCWFRSSLNCKSIFILLLEIDQMLFAEYLNSSAQGALRSVEPKVPREQSPCVQQQE